MKSVLSPMTAADIRRFWAKVDKHGSIPTHRPELGPCWSWDAKHDACGYAMFSLRRLVEPGQHPFVAVGAHRVAYELLVGPIPLNREIDHLCLNRGCVNPAHFEVVTHAVNTLRGTSPQAVNAIKTCCDHGHEFVPDNTYIRSNGHRQCRTCGREAVRRYVARKQAA
jgi:HNH endonuclease